MRFLVDENVSHRICPALVAAGHEAVHVNEIGLDTMPSADLAALILAALSPELDEFLEAGAIATLTPDRVRVRPLPLRPVGTAST
ncbi:DUF5615 family PIN-like protein [Jiangella anatolica]|uniref:DUF5615 domain-containing protein n=1 Tax=Jiangella anatolica TaxID=2670374 RepID=A0A2W2BUW1_9ACTN|nr:DUF5615 family PIN-like protein [Jiangella anatolica]PZF79447.1 hypothetical protein C1I92_31105 [Jiangella anatolica]